jgi:hypothetical protein
MTKHHHTDSERGSTRRTWRARAAVCSALAAGLLLGPVAASSANADAGDPHDTPPVAAPPFDGARCELAANQPEKICWAIPKVSKMLRLHLYNPGPGPVLVHTNGAYGDVWVEVSESKTFILAPGDHVSLLSQRWAQQIDVTRVED